MADLHKLLVHQLDAAKTRGLEELDLRLDEEVECDFGNEEARARSSRVANGGANVLDREVVRRVDALERVSEHVVEDVVDSRSSAELLGRDLERGSVD